MRLKKADKKEIQPVDSSELSTGGPMWESFATVLLSLLHAQSARDNDGVQ